MKEAGSDGRGKGILKVKSHEERAELLKKLCRITGTSTENGAERILTYLSAMQVWGRGDTEERKILTACDLISEFGPSNPTEALLAVQMFSVHEVALMCLKGATAEGQTLEGVNANVIRATKLLRLFNEQVELMTKLKGKVSQQKVVVEHVHIHDGGQAIVGAVSNTKTGRGEGDQ